VKRTFAWIFVLAFLAILALPGAAYLAGYEAENLENRPLAREAHLITRGGLNLSFPEDFDSWWEDHFGLREQMVTAFHAATMAVFRDTLNKKVVVGKGNYLFYSETMNDYLGLDVMSDEQIQKTAAVVRLQREYCESLGMRFVFMIAPNKNTVYPEYMSERYAPTGEPGNRERLYAALEAQGVDTIDLAALLASHKADGDLYYEQDTHWNQRGARIAYAAIMEHLAEGFAYDDYADAEGAELYGYRGDLHNFVLPAVGGRLKYVDYGLDEAKAYSVDEGANPARDISFGTTSGANALRLLMFRDSFGEALIPFVSNNAGRAVYSQEFPYNYLFSGENFDAVAIELVERNIPNLLISAPMMPAVEKDLPKEAERVEAVVLNRGKTGFTQLYGCYDGAFEGAIYIELTYADGSVRAYEAFPVLDAGAADAALPMANPQGFVATLPEEASGWTAARVFAVTP
jgi:hypothetical protein